MSTTKHSREELLYLARLAEQCERYDGKLHFRLVYTYIRDGRVRHRVRKIRR